MSKSAKTVLKETKPKMFVFVLMPFSEGYNDVYELGIRSACQDAGMFCDRVDHQHYLNQYILDRIYTQISKADVIVSDMTSPNLNVLYETGYAHALNKSVILLTDKKDSIPFDLSQYPHIIYKKDEIRNLKSKLEKKLLWYKESHPASHAPVNYSVSLVLPAEEEIIKTISEGITPKPVISDFHELKHDTEVTLYEKNKRVASFIPHRGIIFRHLAFLIVAHKIIRIIEEEEISFDTFCALSESGNCLVAFLKSILEKPCLRCDQKTTEFIPENPRVGEKLLLLDTVFQTGSVISKCKNEAERTHNARVIKTISVINNDMLNKGKLSVRNKNNTDFLVNSGQISFLYKMSHLYKIWQGGERGSVS